MAISQWSDLRVSWDLCFPIPLYSGLVKIPSLPFIWPVSDALCTFCPNLPVHSTLLSDRWCQLFVPYRSPLPTTECLQVTPSVGSSSSWDGPVYSVATFPATVQLEFKLDFTERATINKIKCEPRQIAAAELLPNEAHATANISLLAR